MPASERSSGLARLVLVGPPQGAVHTELAAGAFAPGGWLRRHIHSFEEGLYVLSGELVLDIGGGGHRLLAGILGPGRACHFCARPDRRDSVMDRHRDTRRGASAQGVQSRSPRGGGPLAFFARAGASQ